MQGKTRDPTHGPTSGSVEEAVEQTELDAPLANTRADDLCGGCHIWWPTLAPPLNMSRAPPFPTRRARSPSVSRDSEYTVPPASAPSTRPLQINRPPSRPTTPGSNYPHHVPSTAPIGPSRPQRSQLRSRVSEMSEDRTSGSYRDSVATTRSDASYYRSRNNSSANPATSISSRPPTTRIQTQSSVMESSEPSSAALDNVMSAFKSAGRRRAMTNGSEDFDYQRERELEIQNEALRQKKIKDKVPGRKVNGKTRQGTIDGQSFTFIPLHDLTTSLQPS
jgi:exocyst complex component 4